MLDQVRSYAGGLTTPPGSLYYQLNQERLRTHCEEVAELQSHLEELKGEAFAAATRLMSLDGAQ